MDVSPGTRLGPYELIGHLGAGGMGEVWKARDTRVDRVVAIKRLKAGHTERFQREARAIAALNHPRICQLYDVGPDYLVMEQDPLSVLWRGILMGHLVCAGRSDEALDEGVKALDITDNEMHPHTGFGEAYLALGRVAEAVAAAERAHRNLPQQSMGAGLLAAALFRLGEKNRAEALLREIGDSPTPIWGRAWYHLLCGELDAAASWYEKMIVAREMFAPVYANSPYTAELRASPHWARLARMMNLPVSLA